MQENNTMQAEKSISPGSTTFTASGFGQSLNTNEWPPKTMKIQWTNNTSETIEVSNNTNEDK